MAEKYWSILVHFKDREREPEWYPWDFLSEDQAKIQVKHLLDRDKASNNVVLRAELKETWRA